MYEVFLGDINGYLREIFGVDIIVKDFRIWNGMVFVVLVLVEYEKVDS